MKQDNRAFQEMLVPALSRLEHRQPEETARKTGILYLPSEHLFKVRTLNREIELDFPSYTPRQRVEEWHYLLILHYMAMADGTPCEEGLVTFGGLKDGLIRGTEFDRYADAKIADFLKGRPADMVRKICERLGGEVISSKADLSVRFWFLPLYPVVLNIWFADEEFPASGKMFLSKSADHFLTVEEAVTAGEIILKLLKEMEAPGNTGKG